MKLYFVRHGETRENVGNIIQGHQAGTLTDLGHAQARRLAQRLGAVEFDAIYASDLGRVVETARYVGAFQRAAVEYDQRLRERGAGIFEGRPRQVLWEAEALSGQPQAEFRPEGGESFLDLQARIEGFVNSILDQHQGQTVLALAHGGWNRQLLGWALELPIVKSLDLVQINTCVNLVEIDLLSRFTVHLSNCITHLDPDLHPAKM
ncbi:MAG: histidine phosphatase family protein [Acidobacteria bacterium]|nr:histidine phosphatase family protein [Acidobacteriota bacterium]